MRLASGDDRCHFLTAPNLPFRPRPALTPKTCANCGTALDADALFCHRCGLNLTQEFRATPLAAVATDEVSETFRRLREALGQRYGIERELGRGGMATVFLARDLKHDREVAIKVLHPDLAATIGGERFEREIKLAAKLQHPHILGLYDSGDADGLLYYVMPFVKGESLRDRIDREKMLPVDDAIRITLEVASALGHAHEQGIIHRDIKPENILLSGEHALVADFGIARAATEAGQSKLTQTGMAVGTPVYMAPEQSTGDQVGPTADIYSLGCMLYEMLAGEPPFTGPNAMAIMARHLMEQVPSVRVVRNTVPEEVEQAIFIALNKAPVDRPQTAQQFAELLGGIFGATSTMRVMRGTRSMMTPMPMTGTFGVQVPPPPPLPWYKTTGGLWTGFGLAVAAASAIWAFTAGPLAANKRPTALTEEMRRVAVLFFKDESPDSSLGPVADGLTDGLIRTLSSSSSLTVISRGGIEPYRGSDVSVDSIARALRVGMLVRGAVELEGNNRVRVAVRLDDASGVSLQSGAFSVARDSVLLLRDSLGAIAANLIRRQLGEELKLREQRASTRNQDAWVLTQRGVQQQRNAEAARARGDAEAASLAFDAADSIFAAAEALDRTWPDPIALRAALAYRRSRLVGRDPALIKPWIATGIGHAERALALDPTNADALEMRGTMKFFSYIQNLELDANRRAALLTEAVADLEKSTTINRSQASAWATLAAAYATVPEKTRDEVYSAAFSAWEADEFLSNANIVLGRLFFGAYDLGNGANAQRWCNELQARFPNDARAWRCQLYLMTLPNTVEANVELAWRLADSALVRTPPGDSALARLTNQNLIGAVIARAAAQNPALADSARRVVQRAQGDGTIDQPRELAMYGAAAMTILGDGDAAIRYLTTYLVASPQAAAGLRDDPGWWFRPISGRPDFQRIVSPR